MSTDAILDMLVDAGRLVPLVPLSPRAMKRRALYVTEDIWRTLEGETLDEITEDRFGRLRADLETFVAEEEIYPHYLFWLTPRTDWIWEIRSIADAPQLRVLGRFYSIDIFIALTVEERAELGGWETQSWQRAKRTTAQRWDALFNHLPPQKGSDENDFFTGAIPGKYWKK